jgi:hypothetical protein
MHTMHIMQVKQSNYRPGQAHRVPGGWGSQISRQSAHEGGKVVSPTHRPPLLPRHYSWYSLVRGWVNPSAIMQPEGLCQWKIPVIPSGIEPATFQLIAQCLNQLRHCVPPPCRPTWNILARHFTEKKVFLAGKSFLSSKVKVSLLIKAQLHLSASWQIIWQSLLPGIHISNYKNNKLWSENTHIISTQAFSKSCIHTCALLTF